MSVDLQKSEWARQGLAAKKEYKKKFDALFGPKLLRTYEEDGHTIKVYESREAINVAANWVRPRPSRSIGIENI